MKITGCSTKFDVIWYMQDVSEKWISFCNLICWPSYVKMISNFNSMCWKQLKIQRLMLKHLWVIRRVFIVVVVNCWFVRKLRGSYLTLFFFFFLPYSLVYGKCNRIEDGTKETRISLNSNFILGFMTILWYGMFSWTSRNSRISLTKCSNIS